MKETVDIFSNLRDRARIFAKARAAGRRTSVSVEKSAHSNITLRDHFAYGLRVHGESTQKLSGPSGVRKMINGQPQPIPTQQAATKPTPRPTGLGNALKAALRNFEGSKK
jgi:hypothetical protein